MKQPLADRLASLSPEQRALLEFRLQKKAAQSSEPSIPIRERRDHLPLSVDQERLWFVHQLDPASAAYNIYTAVRFKGKLQLEALTRSLNEIVHRHEIMRTCFLAPDGQPEQLIAPSLTAAIPLVDLRSIPPEFREREAARLAASNVQRPFDLAHLPLFRTVLLQVQDEEFICPTVFHHIITDWVSFYAFDRELASLYGAFREGQPSPLEPLSIQYADFAAWQRDWLTHKVLDDQVEYWRRRLQGAPPLIELPYDRPRPPVQTASGFRQPLALSPGDTEFIREIGRRYQLTPFIALLALFKILLFRLTRQAHVVVGSPIANRNRPELEKLLGFFINHLVFCTETGGDPLFTEFLLRVKKTALGAYANQDVPFAKVVEEVRPDRDLSRTPLTQVVFLFLNPEQQGEIRLSGLRILPYMIDSESSKFDMTFSLWESESGYSGWIEYNPDLFDRTTILRMGEQFRTLVTSLAENPGQRLSAIPILHDAARQQQLLEWNDSAMECEEDSIVDRVQKQTRLRPGSTAVTDDRETLTFGQLNAFANRLARRLTQLGVGPESRVGVLLPRSVGMVVAWLAVLKAGGAYLPLADDTPRARWEGMLEDAGARVLISDPLLAAGYAGVTLWIDAPEISGLCDKNLDVVIEPQSLAYLIFTSGSTGRPKGVAIEHRSLSNLISWHERAHQVKPGDRATQVANAGFDAAGWEIWPYLGAGASVAILSGEQRLSPQSIIQYLDDAQVTHCFLPTPLAEAVLEEDWRPRSLCVLLTGGDRLSRSPGHLAGKLWNHYGPTESTVAATAGLVEKGGDLPDIGRPIANTCAYILDSSGNPVAVGTVGELYLGGRGLARGYIGRAAETAEKFVPDQFSRTPGQRLYRTGDLVRWGRNGRLHFVGRADEQVKLRGYRIELGEIEAQLTALPGVRAAAAVVNGNGARQRICAYVSGDNLEPEGIRSRLRERLPEYMEPSSICLLDELPVTANGKIDRAGLARREDIPRIAVGSTAPRNQAEETLAAIWRETLGLPQVGVFDNFFALGGDSILSMRVVARARAAGLLLTPRQIFEQQTIAGLAAVAGSSPELAADRGLVTGPAALAPIQRWFLEQDPIDAHHFNQALMLKMELRPSPAVLRCVIAGIEAHHDALRSRFSRTEAGWNVKIAGPGEPPLIWVNLRDAAPSFRNVMIEASAAALQRGLNLGSGPLFRVAFFDCADPLASRLLVIAHHLVVDGVSWRILLEDLETALLQASCGAPICLPAKTASYRLAADQMPPQSARASGVARPDNTVASCAAVEISLDAAKTGVLLEQAGPAFRTQIQDLLLTACSDALAECGTPNGAVDFEGHGRDLASNDLDLSRTVGWFTVIRTLQPASNNSGPLERLRQAKRYLRASFEGRTVQSAGCADLIFNYLGRLDLAVSTGSMLQPVAESVGNLRSPLARRSYLFEVDAAIVAGCLQVRWVYSRNIHSDQEVRELAAAFERSLLRLLDGRAAGDSFVPQDFPLAELHQAQLDALVARYGAFEDAYSLSPVQEGMLLHALSSGHPGAFHEHFACSLSGPLNVQRFEESWRCVVDRHPALRTCFAWSEFDRPVQVVLPRGGTDLVLAVSEGSPLRQEKPLDLTQAPLMRLALISAGDQTWRFEWTCHHLILDGWSLPLALRQVMDAYAAASGQSAPHLQSRPYVDFVRWLKRQDPCRAEEYWRRTLRGFRSPTPIGGAAVALDAGHREDELFDLPAALTGALRAQGHDRQLTLNTVFQGAWALLLSRACGQDDVVFGVTASGRPADLPGSESIVGAFATTQPLRARIRSEAPVIEWLEQLQAQQVEAREFEFFPLAQQFSEIPLGLPLFETLLVFENYPVDPGVPHTVGGIEVGQGTMLARSRFPLTLIVLPGDGLRLCLSYDSRRFTSETGRAILQDLCDLLARITTRRDWTLGSLIDHEPRWRPSVTAPMIPDEAAGMEDRPRTPVEELVLAVWSGIVGFPPVTLNRSLFEMGGHSLVATRLASRLREVFNISLPLKQVFEAPTIAGLAKCIENQLVNRGNATLPPVEPLAVRTGNLPLSYAQEPIWLVQKALPGTVFYNFFAIVRLEGALHLAALARSFETIVGRHEALRSLFDEVDGRAVQRIQPKVDFAMPLIDISALQESHRTDAAASLATRESRRPFHLSGESLLRAACLRVGEQEHLLCLSMHHIATDGWSSGILARELMQLYDAYSRGHAPVVAPLALQQPDFAVWERERAAAGDFNSHVWYWIDQLESGVAPLELPTDRPRGHAPVFVAREEYEVTDRLCGKLRELSQREDVSLFMTLLTGLKTVLSATAGQADFWVGTLVAGRNQMALENPIGLFVNTVLLRCQVDPADSRHKALQRTRSAVFEAFEHQELPFELLLEAIDGELGIDKARLCPILFIMQNTPMDHLRLSGLRVTPIATRSTGVREVFPTSFEMIINIDEHPEKLIVNVSYKSELFDSVRVDKMASDWGQELEAMAEELSTRGPNKA